MQSVEGESALWLSAKTGAGVELLRDHLKDCMGYHGSEGTLMARRRHLEALERAAAALALADEQLIVARAGELAAEELRQAQNALGEITGVVTSDELLENRVISHNEDTGYRSSFQRLTTKNTKKHENFFFFQWLKFSLWKIPSLDKEGWRVSAGVVRSGDSTTRSGSLYLAGVRIKAGILFSGNALKP